MLHVCYIRQCITCIKDLSIKDLNKVLQVTVSEKAQTQTPFYKVSEKH